MIITQQLKKWGNSSGVRIPKEVANKARINLDEELEITVSGRNIILSPVKGSKKSIHELMKGVTPEKVGGEIDWGGDLGAEKW